MSEKDNKPGHKDIVQCLIGDGVELQGDITVSGGLHIDGKVRGNITMREGKAARLTLSGHGVIDGNVTVNDADINGKIKGDVHARGKITLHSQAYIKGDVYYGAIEIKRGARINGQLIVVDDPGKRGSGTREKLKRAAEQQQQ